MEKVKKHISRIVTFDLMRGYFLVAIIIDHINYFPNGLGWWSARGGLFVTAAEGFFLISGIVLGIVRGSKLIDQPFRKVAKLLLSRAFQLYVTAAVLILLFTAIGWIFFANNPGLKPGIASPDTNIFTVIWQTLTLQYYYGWADYLRLYAIFLLVSPFVFWLLRHGKWYIVLILSLLVWMLFPNDPSVAYETQEYLQPLSWQMLFFIGAIVGFHWNNLVDAWRSLSKKLKNIITGSLLGIAGVTFIINVMIMLSTMGFNFDAIGINPQLQQDLYIAFFDKERMPLTRVLLSLIWFWAAYVLFRRFEKPVVKFMGWLLVPYGMNSLYVYTFHALAVFFVHLLIPSGNLLQNFLIVSGVILGIRLLIHYKFMMKIVPR